MKTHKITLIILAILSTIGFASSVYAGFSIRLKKSVPQFMVAGVPTDVTFKIFDAELAATPITSQTFSMGSWSAERVSRFPFGNNIRFKVDFTNTDALTKNMELWMEMELDGVVKGNRERIKQKTWSLFSMESFLTDEATHAIDADTALYADTAGDADTVDGVHAADLEESTEIDADIVTHAGNASAHHTRYTDAEAQAAVSGQYYTKTEVDALLAAYESRIAALETKLDKVTMVGNNIYIDGANLYIRSGSGGTEGINGLGNLIVGYNESTGQTRTGSHNLIIGPYHIFSSYGGLVAGYQNAVTGCLLLGQWGV